MATKRSYTVPVLLLLVTVLGTFALMQYSKVLIGQQNEKMQVGQSLTSKYNYALLFADSLSAGVELMLKDGSMADRVRAKKKIGEALTATGEATSILSEAIHRSTGKPIKDTFAPISAAMAAIMSENAGRMYTVGEHEGPLTLAERAMLHTVGDGAARMKQALMSFSPPTGEAGYRQMAAGGPWIDAALKAAKALEDTAAKLK